MTKKANMRTYLEAYGSITSLKAMRVLGTDAPKDLIYKLRRDGMPIITTSQKDVLGNRYTKWILA